MGRARPRRPGALLRPAALTLLACTLLPLLVLYKPMVAPFSVQERNLFTHGVAKRTILVDTPTSNLVDRDQTSIGPPSVALTYALYLQTDLARSQVAAAVGRPTAAVATSGPYTMLLPRPNLVIARQNPVPSPPKPSERDYRLLLDVTEAQPTLSIFAQAPTEREARTMVAAATAVIGRYVAEQQRRNPVAEESRSVLRPLGGIDSATVDGGAGVQLAIACFLICLAGAGLIWYRIGRRRSIVAGGPERSLPAEPMRPATDDWPHTNRLLPWMLAAFLVMLYVIPFGAVEVPLPLPGDGVLDRPFIYLLLFVWVTALITQRGSARPRVRITRVHVAVLGFFAVCLLSAAINAGPLSEIGLLGTAVKKLVVLVNYVALFLVASSCIRPREVPRFAALLAVLSGITAIGALIESRFDFNIFYELSNRLFPGMVAMPSDLHGLDEIGRATIYGSTSQPLELATILALATPFAVLGLLDSSERRMRLRYAALLAMLLAGAFSTGRKSSVLVPAVALIVILIYRPGSLRRLLPVGAVLVVVVNVLAPGMLWSLYFQLMNVGGVKSTQARSADYDAVWSDFTGHLLLGRGFKAFDPHVYRILDNEYLGLIIGVGVIGTIAFLTIFGTIISSAHATIRAADPVRARYALAGASAAAACAFASLLFDMLSFAHVPYLLLFIAGMVLALREASPAADEAPGPEPPARAVALAPSEEERAAERTPVPA
jgi:hypothetical protein